MTLYRCKHAVEAMRWTDTHDDRVAFAVWFEKHDLMFETRGPDVMAPGHKYAVLALPGEWVLWSHGEFIAMDDESFRAEYEQAQGDES